MIGYRLFSGTQPGVYTASQDVGNVTQRVMTLPPGTYYFAVRAYDSFGMESDLSAEVSTTIAAQPQPTPTWQAVWHNVETGQIGTWDMSGVSMVSGGPLGGGRLDPAWRLQAHADMNGDGVKDVILQHLRLGYLAVWIMTADQQISETRMINQLIDPAWLLVGAADFNADGQTDLIFEHTVRGTIAAWLMNGTQVTEGTPITPNTVSDPNWRIVAAEDMNGDAKPDLVWQQLTTGWITTWLMNGTSMQSAGPFSTAGPSDPEWRLRGVADIDNNGAPDLLWQHLTKGYVAAWILSGLTVVDSRLLSPGQVGTNWLLTGGR